MRLSRAIKVVTVLGICSSVITICLWSSCSARQSDGFDRGLETLRGERGADENDVLTFHNRGTNSIASDQQPPLQPGDRDQAQADHWQQQQFQQQQLQQQLDYHEIDCNINNERTIKCRKEGPEVYVPFSFVKKYFEVYGDVVSTDGYERLEFHHANSIVHPPRATYTPSAMFMAFDHYNVENRERVKCITASEGVPITTQWNKEGYHYSIQVAQYGLSHHAKHIVTGEPDQLVLEDAEDEDGGVAGALADWQLPDKKSRLVLARHAPGLEEGGDNRVVEFLTSDSLSSKGITLPVDEKANKCVSMDVKFSTNGSVIIVVETVSRDRVSIHYVFTGAHIASDGKSNVFYGLGERHNEWMHIARDLKFDVQKGFSLKGGKPDKSHTGIARIVEIRLHGHGWLDNLTLSSAIHMEQFYDAANWLVKHQDERGGWPIMVARRVVPGVLELPPGWYSAMGQGQAMSVLVRAYLDSKEKRYLRSAVEALKLFEIDSVQGGVRARFLGQLDWYEEYPTTPSSFVLNGFIYSLMGLYDLKETASGRDKETAERIYSSGMKSLKVMIGLYDSGVGTLYDLRHITAGIEPNRARWDYHTTHINQVLQLMVIDDDPIFKTTVQRWLGYLQGRKSRHN
ncbi:D-glucuronyl C5-epimerase B [Aplysia californica]|uniref:heparosan-N-sulfate-glucuronate 5-epimerase n=1 Tax=Aplysia californica TaxID=6500 RepID=A0ABM0JY16_APLCA|nr:D-glucuronyl C5-epimerase B [Aplysia californica]